MTTFAPRRRLALAALLAATALSPAAAQAAPKPVDCETRLERIEQRFREVEERRGYEYATKWWEKKWAQYHKRCVIG